MSQNYFSYSSKEVFKEHLFHFYEDVIVDL